MLTCSTRGSAVLSAVLAPDRSPRGATTQPAAGPGHPGCPDPHAELGGTAAPPFGTAERARGTEPARHRACARTALLFPTRTRLERHAHRHHAAPLARTRSGPELPPLGGGVSRAGALRQAARGARPCPCAVAARRRFPAGGGAAPPFLLAGGHHGRCGRLAGASAAWRPGALPASCSSLPAAVWPRPERLWRRGAAGRRGGRPRPSRPCRAGSGPRVGSGRAVVGGHSWSRRDCSWRFAACGAQRGSPAPLPPPARGLHAWPGTRSCGSYRGPLVQARGLRAGGEIGDLLQGL